MKDKIKKILTVFLLVFFCFILIMPTLKADSGWDMDYDYGGSDWGSSSSWSSSSDWGTRDYDYGYSGSSSSGSGEVDFSVFVIIFIIYILVSIIRATLSNQENSNDSTSTSTNKNKYHDISEEEANKYGINLKEFKIMAYDKYVNIQNAWSNFDFDKLSELLSNELFNSYKMQLDTLKIKNQRNIMKDITYLDARVISASQSGNVVEVKVYLNISMYDYVVNHNETIVRGTNRRKVNIEYLLTFVKDASNEIKKCPNCGNEIHMKVSGTCEYCRSKIIITPSEYVMSKKTNIGQKWE